MTRGITPATDFDLARLERYADEVGDDGLASVILRLKSTEAELVKAKAKSKERLKALRELHRDNCFHCRGGKIQPDCDYAAAIKEAP